VEIVAQLDAAMKKTEAEFGMSPSSRTRIEATPPAEEKADGKSKFFGPKIADAA
jgi:phage terminase small subunit